jgi:glucose 1-dehydrogenase
MRAVVVRPPAPGASLATVPDPVRAPGQVLVRTLEVGVCGTDRDIVAGRYGTPPPGRDSLVVGHENLGVVEEADAATGFCAGDVVVSTVRRGCGICRFCNGGHSDFCESRRYTERGIRGRDGYLAERYVEDPSYMVPISPELRGEAVLLEPLSVVEKAIEGGRAVLARMDAASVAPLDRPLRALVTGTGAVGMLGALLLAVEGAQVTVIDRHGADTPAAALLGRMGAEHLNAAAGLSVIGDRRFDLILEASGSPVLDFDLPAVLGVNGVLVLTGIPPDTASPIPVTGGRLLRELVLENQVILGSVNANRGHFARGVERLRAIRARFGDLASRLITARLPWEEFGPSLDGKGAETIKTVLEVAAS